MSVLKESQVDDRVVRWFKKTYPTGVCIKLGMVGAHGTAGWPDRLFVVNGRALFMEMKAAGKEPTPLQAQRLCEIKKAGYDYVTWVDNPEDGIERLKAAFG